MIRFVIRASYGNDSIALIQWAHEEHLEDVTVLYSDTGWARSAWALRVIQMELWAESLNFKTARTESIGMEALVEQRKMFPQRLMQFCTKELKILPTIAWLEKNDPERRAIILTGIRREESTNRAAASMFRINSANDGGRCVIQPLATFTAADRDILIRRAGHEPLDHRSEECLCINSGRKDILRWDEQDIQRIEKMEAAPLNSKGKPRTMFRPNKFMGAVGIREVVRWAHSARGKYEGPEEKGEPCDNEWCER